MFTGRRRPHQEVASEQHLASPFGIAQEGLGRRWQLGEQGREQQRIPMYVRYGFSFRDRVTNQSRVSDELACQPEERLLEIII